MSATKKMWFKRIVALKETLKTFLVFNKFNLVFSFLWNIPGAIFKFIFKDPFDKYVGGPVELIVKLALTVIVVTFGVAIVELMTITSLADERDLQTAANDSPCVAEAIKESLSQTRKPLTRYDIDVMHFACEQAKAIESQLNRQRRAAEHF